MKYLSIILLTLLSISCSTKNNSTATSLNTISEDNPIASFKRSVPKEVQPILIENIKYSCSMNEIIATDTLSQNILWKKEIYKVIYDEKMERDVQDVYIDSISLKDNLMIIRNENTEFYSLNIKTKEVIQIQTK